MHAQMAVFHSLSVDQRCIAEASNCNPLAPTIPHPICSLGLPPKRPLAQPNPTQPQSALPSALPSTQTAARVPPGGGWHQLRHDHPDPPAAAPRHYTVARWRRHHGPAPTPGLPAAVGSRNPSADRAAAAGLGALPIERRLTPLAPPRIPNLPQNAPRIRRALAAVRDAGGGGRRGGWGREWQ